MMRRFPYAYLIALLLFSGVPACVDKSSAPMLRFRNQAPVILNVQAFPSSIGPADSVVVLCTASDPDGDQVVYDWLTDGRMQLRDALPGDAFVNNLSGGSEVLRPRYVPLADDTVWVQCQARDGRGGAAIRIVRIPIHH